MAKIAPSVFHLAQQSFGAGEISPEVANRIDLDKYQYALLKARNVYIRPYGPAYKRGGMVHCVATKYAAKKCILVEFNYSKETNYLLEIGDQYIRIHKNGQYLNKEVVTPFKEEDLDNLRFAQSVDVMFIASGAYPVKMLSHKADDSWTLDDFDYDSVYFDMSLKSSVETEDEIKVTPSATEGDDVTLTASADLFSADQVGNYIQLTQNVPTESVKKDATSSTSGEQDSTSSSVSANRTLTVTIKGDWVGTIKLQKGSASSSGFGETITYTWTDVKSYTSNTVDMLTSVDGLYRISAKLTKGMAGIELVAVNNVNIAEEGEEPIYVDRTTTINHTATSDAGTGTLLVGDTWKILTGGTWTGTVTVQRKVNDEWQELRTYQSKDNYNVTETGTVKEETEIRAIWNISSGTCTLTLSRLPYDKIGFAKITKWNSKTSVDVDVIEKFGNTKATTEYAWGAWGEGFGYPSCVCFFQDRLCFAASKEQPHVLWMSKTGDYHNFGVKKVDGDVLDDSAIAAAFISRKQYKIQHLVPSTDLLVLTDGNEWLVNGNEVVTPSNMSPRVQTTRGCNHCEPLQVGSRLLFIQARGSNVRDMGYTYETDSYVGADLTLLTEHLIRGKDIVDVTYKAEPNSMVYCVRNDGVVMCLSYIREQEIYAWATVETDGKVEAVCCVGEGDEDIVYAVTKRGNVRYIEYFANDVYTDLAQDYTMLDSSVRMSVTTATDTFTASHLAGKTITVLADGREHLNIVVGNDGTFKIPAKVKNVVAGLPYDMEIELPSAETALRDGTTQGRMKMVSNATLRLRKSLGGSVGATFDVMDDIKFDEFSTTDAVEVFTGDKKVNVPLGGFDQEGRVCIKSSDPYPFMLMAIVREVTFGG